MKLPAPAAILLDVRSRGALTLSILAWAALAASMQSGGHFHAPAAAGHFSSHLGGIFALPMWTLMIVATSPIVIGGALTWLCRASLPRMRAFAASAFCAGYFLAWVGLGLPLLVALQWFPATYALLLVTAIAVVWHCSPARQRCFNACHRLPALRAFGSGVVVDATRFGARTGCYCAAACGLLMLLPLFAGTYQLQGMIGAAIIMAVERRLPPRRPQWQWPLYRSLARELQSSPTADAQRFRLAMSPAS